MPNFFIFTSTVKFLPQTLLEFLGIFSDIVHLILHTVHYSLRVFRVHQGGEAFRHRWLKWLQGSYDEVSDEASFLECLFPILPVRRFDLELPI